MDPTYTWELLEGDGISLVDNGPVLHVETAGASGAVVFLLTASTADESALASDDLTITLDPNAIPVDSASCDPRTGHCYALARSADGSRDLLWWDEARAAANRMVHAGMRGHLATVTSVAEGQFLAGVAYNAPNVLGGVDRDEEGVAMRLAHLAVQIENQPVQRNARLHQVNPRTGHVHQGHRVIPRTQDLGLEPTHLAAGRGTPLLRPAAHNVTPGRIDAQRSASFTFS